MNIRLTIAMLAAILLTGSTALHSQLCAMPYSAKSAEAIYLDNSTWNRDWFLIDKSGKQIKLDPSYHTNGYFTNDIDKFAKKIQGKWKYGYINSKGKVVIAPKYNYASPFCGGIAIAGTSKDYLSIISLSGKVISKFPKHLQPNSFHGLESGFYSAGLISVSSRGKAKKYGYIDHKGNIVVPIIYDSIRPFCEGLALVAKGNNYGFVNKQGKEVIPPKYLYAYGFSDGLAAVYTKDGGNYIDTSGKTVISSKYERVGYFIEGLSPFKINEKWGYLNKKGEVAINPEFEYASNFSEGLACVKSDGKWGFIDREGRFVIEPKFYNASSFKDGTAVCAINLVPTPNEIFNMDTFWRGRVSTRILIENKFEPIAFNNYITPKVKFGLINKKGEFILKPKYDAILESVGRIRTVILDSKFGFIDSKGKEIIKPSYSDAKSFHGKVAWVKKFVGDKQEPKTRQHDPIVDFSNCYDPGFLIIQPDLLEANIRICSEVIDAFPASNNALYMRSKLNYTLKNYTDAIQDLNKAIQRDPSNYYFLVLRGYVNLHLDKPKQAESDFRKALKPYAVSYRGIVSGQQLVPTEDAYHGLQKSLIMQNKISEFLKVPGRDGIFFPNLIVIDNKNDLFFKTYMKVKNYKKAEKTLANCYHSTVYNLRYPLTERELDSRYKVLKRKLNEISKGTDNVHPLTVLKTKLDLVLLITKLIPIKKSNYKVLDLQRLVKEKTDLFPSLNPYEMKYSKGRFYCSGGDTIYSLRFYQSKIQTELNDPRVEAFYLKMMKTSRAHLAYYMYGDYLAKQGRLKEAMTYYNLSEFPDLTMKKAHLLIRLGQKKKAEKLIESASKRKNRKFRLISLSRASSPPQYNRAVKEPQFLPAAPIPDGKENADGYFELAKTSFSLGLANSSIKYLNKAMELTQDEAKIQKFRRFKNTNLPPKRISLKTNARYIGNKIPFVEYGYYPNPSTESNLKSCMEEEPLFTSPYVDLMRYYNNIGNFNDALRTFNAVLRVNSNCLGAWVEAGRMYNLQSKVKQARQALLKVQELDPENQYAKVILDSFDNTTHESPMH